MKQYAALDRHTGKPINGWVTVKAPDRTAAKECFRALYGDDYPTADEFIHNEKVSVIVVTVANAGRLHLSVEVGEHARDVSMAAVDAAAAAEWKVGALQAVRDVAATHADFTADDVWATGLTKPREPRALGPILIAAVRERLIERTDRVRRTKQVLRHAAPVTVWRSLIHAR